MCFLGWKKRKQKQSKSKGSVGYSSVLSQVVSFPDRIFRARRKNGSGQLPIPFSFKCAGMLAHCSFLMGVTIFTQVEVRKL